MSSVDVTAFVHCSTDGCDIIVGNGAHGARSPRPCCRCAAQVLRDKSLNGYHRRTARRNQWDPTRITGYDRIADLAE